MRLVGGALVAVVWVVVDDGDGSPGALAIARERLDPYGGREAPGLGEGLVAVFPTPRQALAFAVAMQRTDLGRGARLRVGVSLGEVRSRAGGPQGEAVD